MAFNLLMSGDLQWPIPCWDWFQHVSSVKVTYYVTRLTITSFEVGICLVSIKLLLIASTRIGWLIFL